MSGPEQNHRINDIELAHKIALTVKPVVETAVAHEKTAKDIRELQESDSYPRPAHVSDPAYHEEIGRDYRQTADRMIDRMERGEPPKSAYKKGDLGIDL